MKLGKKKSDKKKERVEFTGERFIPGIEEDELAIEHMQRYQSVLQIVKGKKVLDIACGEGYGTEILAEEAKEITGIDIDAAVIQRAKERYKKENLNYMVGDIAAIPFSDCSIDVVISFETIEHVEEEQQKLFLIEIKRILKPDGILVISTPNKAVYSDRNQYHNKWHKKEFYKGEFIAFIRKEFAYLTLYHQYGEVIHVIEHEKYEEISYGAIFYRGKEREGKYYIVVASNQNQLPTIPPILRMRFHEEYERCILRIQHLQKEEEERNHHIQKLDQEIQKKDSRIVELQDSERSRNQHIAKLDAEIEEKKRYIQENRKQIEILEIKLQYEERNKIQIQECLERDQKKEELYYNLQREFDEFKRQRMDELRAVELEKGQIINDLMAEIKEKNARFRNLEDKLIEQEQKRKVMQEVVDNYREKIEELEKEKREQEQKIEEIQKVGDSYKEKLEEMENVKRENEMVLSIITEKDSQIQKLEKSYQALKQTSLQQQEQIKQEMEQQIRNKEGHIELLLESDRELERIKHSRSWKLMSIIWKVNGKVFPMESKRRLCGKLLLRTFQHPIQSIKMLFTPRKLRNFFYYLKKDGVAFVSKRVDESYIGIKVEPDTLVIEQVKEEPEKDITQYEYLNFIRQENPTVSIIIPVYNQFEYTYNCLKSILSNSGEVSYEIIIANDASTDLTNQLMEIAKNIKMITNSENLRFLKNCNHAAKAARGKYLFFLNNDTQVQLNWLQPLVDLMESDSDIGMTGSKLVYADGRLQEAGGILWKDGSAWNYGNRSNAEDPEYNYVKDVDYISGAAILIRRSLWEEIGGFDERFAPAYCEDSDLAFEVRKHGYKVVYQPLSVVVHFEGVSNGTDIDSGQKAYQTVNQKKFLDKWKDVLEKEHFSNAENVFLARDRSRGKPILLMVDHYVPQYDKDAGSRTVLQYLTMFVHMGYHVKFIGDNFYRHEPYTMKLQQMGIEVLYGPYYANNWKKWIKENEKYIQFIFLNRPHISVKYIDYIKNQTKAKVIYYGHDLHFLREMRRYELTKDKKALVDSKEWKEKELKLMHQADVVYYPSKIEVEEIAKIDSTVHAKAIIAYIFSDIVQEKYQYEKRKDIMFVGGFTHTPNVDAVLWFVKDILPIIKKKVPDIRFIVMGSNPPEEVKNLADETVLIKGFVTEEELEQYYKNCKLSVVPLRYGAGIKGKVVEAMRYGIPVVTTSVGAEGIIGAEKILCVADTEKEIGEKLAALYRNEKKLSKMSAASYEYIRHYFSEEHAWEVIEEDFRIS